MDDLDLELEYRLTWRGAGGGKTGAVRQNLTSAKKEWLKQVARKSGDLQLQVREVPEWNEPMDRADAEDMLGVDAPIPDWNAMPEEDQHMRAWGHCARFPIEPPTPEWLAFYDLCRAEMAAGRALPEWSR